MKITKAIQEALLHEWPLSWTWFEANIWTTRTARSGFALYAETGFKVRGGRANWSQCDVEESWLSPCNEQSMKAEEPRWWAGAEMRLGGFDLNISGSGGLVINSDTPTIL